MLLWSIIQLPNVANSVGVPPGPRQSLPAIFVPPPTHTPHLGVLWTPRHCDSRIEDRAQVTGATLPVVMKSASASTWAALGHDCVVQMLQMPSIPSSGQLWGDSLQSSPVGSGEATLCGTWPELTSLPDSPHPPDPFSCFPYLFTGVLGAHFLMHLLIKNTALGVCFWVPRPTADRPPFL